MRIISLSPSATEILFAIGAGRGIIANTIYCDYPPQSKSIPKVGSFIRIDVEKIRAMKPDIIFTSSIVQEKIFQELETANLPVCHTDPRSLDGIYESILQTGKAVHKVEQARGIVVGMKRTEKKMRAVYYKNRPKIYIEEWFNPPMISGSYISSYCGFGKNSNPNHLLNRPGWKNLRAVKENHLCNLDETILNRPGPRILQAVSDIQKVISHIK